MKKPRRTIRTPGPIISPLFPAVNLFFVTLFRDLFALDFQAHQSPLYR
jgi:hypothetical protein